MTDGVSASSDDPAAGSIADRIVDAVRSAWTDGETASFERLVALDYARVAADGSRTDLPSWRAVIQSAREGFPDLTVTIEDVVHQTASKAEKVAIRWLGTGTHDGSYLGVPPTHRRVAWEGATFFEIAEGSVVRERGTWVPDQLLGALGVYFLSNE